MCGVFFFQGKMLSDLIKLTVNPILQNVVVDRDKLERYRERLKRKITGEIT